MVNYETVFILTPVLSEEQAKEAVKDYQALLKKKSKVLHVEEWGLKKLAYPIQKKTTGFYSLMQFEAEGSVIAEFETELKRDERVMRFLTVKMDPDHVSWAGRRRAKMAGKA